MTTSRTGRMCDTIAERWERAPCLLKTDSHVSHWRCSATILPALTCFIFSFPMFGSGTQSAKVREAWRLFNSSQKDKSVAMAEAALKLNPKSADWHEVLALSLPRSKYQYQQALTALSLNPSCARIMTTCAILDYQQGSTQEALRLAERAAQIDPNDGRTLAVLATCQSLLGNQAESERLFYKAVKLNPRDHDVNLLAAAYFTHQANEAQAASAFQRLAETYPKSADFLVLRGKDKRSKNDLTGALSDFDLAVKLEPKNIAAVAVRAKLLTQLGRHKEASAGFEKWAEVQGDSAIAHLQLAKSCMNKGDFQKAILAFDRAIQLANEPNNATVYLSSQTGLSVSQYQLCWVKRMELCEKYGQADLALAQATTMLQAEPNSNSALEVRQNILRKKGRYAEAIADLTKLIALDNDVSDWYKDRAEAYQKIHKIKEAESDLARAKHIDQYGK
jgi:tetratricopeptide (TPR) repeat protein